MSLALSKQERTNLWTGVFWTLLVAVGIAIIAIPACVLGQDPTVPVADDPGKILSLIIAALGSAGPAKWIGLSLVGVLGLVWIVRWIAKGRTAKWAAWVLSDEGGTVLGWLASTAGALAVHVIGGGKLGAGELAAVAVGLRAGTSLAWSDSRRIVRALTPLVRLIPGVGKPLGELLDAISGANAKAEIAKATADAYKKLDPAPDAQAAADILLQPPMK